MITKLTREFYIPKDAKKTKSGEGYEIYTRTTANGRICALGFGGKRSKPDFYNSFRNEESRDKKIDNYISNIASGIERKTKWAQDKKAPHTFVVGDILNSSWGYDQTNKDFYQVTEVLSNRTIVVRQISKKVVDSEGLSSMAGYFMPVKDAFIGESMKKLVTNGHISFGHSFLSASKWGGSPEYVSWYA